MRREDCVDMFKRVPELSHAYTNLVMRNQSVLAVDIVVRFEPTYLVMKPWLAFKKGPGYANGRWFSPASRDEVVIGF